MSRTRYGGCARVHPCLLPRHTAAPRVQGDVKATILLASGWWGVSRHFHYVPEVLAAFCWSVPGGFTHLMPHFYYLFLAILLVDRGERAACVRVGVRGNPTQPTAPLLRPRCSIS